MLEDLPNVAHDCEEEVQKYTTATKDLNSEFARYARSAPPSGHGVKHEPKLLFNHLPQPLPPDDLFRCEHIPLKKGACWRDLGTLSKDGTRTIRNFKWIPLDNGKVRNRPDNNGHPDSQKLPAGNGRDPTKCIVPQYCINKAQADSIEPSERESKKGTKSLARLWWDEIFTTCIGRMHIHSHRNMHPGEFRSFSAREYARAQGFPDWCVVLT